MHGGFLRFICWTEVSDADRTGQDRTGQVFLTEIEQGLHYIVCTTYAYARQSDADKSKVSDAYITARTHA